MNQYKTTELRERAGVIATHHEPSMITLLNRPVAYIIPYTFLALPQNQALRATLEALKNEPRT